MSEHTQTQDSRIDTGAPCPGASGFEPAVPPSLRKAARTILETTVTRDVIPRLVALPWIGRAAPPSLRASASHALVGPRDVAKLVALCLAPDTQGVAAFIAETHRSGVEAEEIYEGLMTPAARRLGDMWVDDTCTFADVTLGVLRLQNAQRALAARPIEAAPPHLGMPSALLLPVPGEQHTFGLSIVLDYFLRAGWEARLGPAGSRADALAQVRRERFELLGLSFACDDRISDAAALIAAVRSASANKNIVVLVGGPSFVANPALAAEVGADATALDGQQAVVRANELLHRPEAKPGGEATHDRTSFG